MKNLTLRPLLVCSLLIGSYACGGDDDDGEPGPDADVLAADAGAPDANPACATSTLTYDDFATTFFEDFCRSCHSTNAANRFGAPSSVNFDTFEEVEALLPRIRARAAAGSSMPPGGNPRPETEDRAEMLEWIECGAPN